MMLPEKLNQFHFVLASKSPRRQFLLGELGIEFVVDTKEVDESFPEHLQREDIPLYLCRKKADAFEGKLDEKTILITADTIVWINNHVLNKPLDAEDARLMLRELSGNRHEVYTGVCLKSKKKEIVFCVKTDVYFKELSEAEIDFYVSTYQPFDKAGAYGAQECLPPGENPCSEDEIFFLESLGKTELIEKSKTPMKGDKGKMIVEKIEGSYFNVMGLPLKELVEELGKF